MSDVDGGANSDQKTSGEQDFQSVAAKLRLDLLLALGREQTVQVTLLL
jgi:hypothetical protein